MGRRQRYENYRGSTTAYYRDSLYFKEAVDVSTAKPIYDLTCKFMYQETAGLLSEREYFYNHYNVDSDEA